MTGAINQSIAQGKRLMQVASNASNTIKLKPDDKRLLDACQEFEAIFVKQMLTSMKKTVEKSGLIDGGMTEDIFEDWLYDEYAAQISKRGDLGLSQKMFHQLKGISGNGYQQGKNSVVEHPHSLNRKS